MPASDMIRLVEMVPVALPGGVWLCNQSPPRAVGYANQRRPYEIKMAEVLFASPNDYAPRVVVAYWLHSSIATPSYRLERAAYRFKLLYGLLL